MIHTDAAQSATSLDIDTLAASLDQAARTDAAPSPPSLRHPMALAEACAIQVGGVRIRGRRGGGVVGVQSGYTSKAKAAQRGISDVVIGVLHDSMRCRPDELTVTSRWWHPRDAPEIASRLGRNVDLADPRADILRCSLNARQAALRRPRASRLQRVSDAATAATAQCADSLVTAIVSGLRWVRSTSRADTAGE